MAGTDRAAIMGCRAAMTPLRRRAARPPHRSTKTCNGDTGRDRLTQATAIWTCRKNTLALHGTVQRQGAFLEKHAEQGLEI